MKKITFLFSVLVALVMGVNAQDVGVIGFQTPSTPTYNLPANGQLNVTAILKNFGSASLVEGNTVTIAVTIEGQDAGGGDLTIPAGMTVAADEMVQIPFKPIDLSTLPAGTYQFCVATAGTSLGADPNPANDQSCFTLIVGGSSVEEKSLAQFSAFPNPANNMINVVSPVAFETVRLFDMAGREVYSFNANEMNHQINVSNLPVGLYFLSIEADGNKSTKKVSIAR